MLAKWNSSLMTYNCFVKLSSRNEAGVDFTLDTGASFTILGALVLIAENMLSIQNALGVNDFFQLMRLAPKQFENASGNVTNRYLCYIAGVEIAGTVLDKFYFFLDPNPTSIALIGNDIIHNCRIKSDNSGNIVLSEFNYTSYLSDMGNFIKRNSLVPLPLNALLVKLDQYEDIKNTASVFREYYNNGGYKYE